MKANPTLAPIRLNLFLETPTYDRFLIETNGAILTPGDVTDVIDAYYVTRMHAGVRN